MEPEERLILSAILLAISEQDVRFVTWIKYGNTREDTIRIKLLTQRKALKWVASPEFDELCQVVNIDANRMRSLDPEEAHKRFINLVDPRKDL